MWKKENYVRHILEIADPLINFNNTITATYAADSALLAVSGNATASSDKLQMQLSALEPWHTKWH